VKGTKTGYPADKPINDGPYHSFSLVTPEPYSKTGNKHYTRNGQTARIYKAMSFSVSEFLKFYYSK